MIAKIKNLLNRYVLNRDIQNRRKEVMETLENGKRREANALYRVARATGDEDVKRRAHEAEREARRIRQQLHDDVALDVFAGRHQSGAR